MKVQLFSISIQQLILIESMARTLDKSEYELNRCGKCITSLCIASLCNCSNTTKYIKIFVSVIVLVVFPLASAIISIYLKIIDEFHVGKLLRETIINDDIPLDDDNFNVRQMNCFLTIYFYFIILCCSSSPRLSQLYFSEYAFLNHGKFFGSM